MPTVSSQNYTGLYGAGGTVTPGTAYGNANVVGLLSAGSDGANTVSNIVATGTVTANAFVGDGSQLTNLPAGDYSNANVAAFLPTYSGALTANTISATGNIITDSYFVGNFAGNITGNITVPGSNTQVLFNNSGNVGASSDLTFNDDTNVLSVTGNITATNIAGSGAAISNITGANVTGAVAQATQAATANVALVANSVAGANVSGAVAQATQAATANVANSVAGANVSGAVALATQADTANVALVANSVAGANVTGVVAQATQAATANVANSVAGANVTGVVAQATQANAANTAVTVTGAAQGNITSVGTLTGLSVSGTVTAGNLLINTDAVITGNLTVNGTTTTINSNVITVNDKTFVLANNQSTGAGVDGSGIIAGNPAVASILYSNANTAWETNIGVNVVGNVSATGNITGNYFIGDGSQLTNLPGGTYGNANVAAYLPTFVGNIGNSSSTPLILGTYAPAGTSGAGALLLSPSQSYLIAQSPTLLARDSAGMNQVLLTAKGAGTGNLEIVTDNANAEHTWTFTGSGNLSLPSNTAAINYANGVNILSGLASTYSNANVAAYLPTYSGNVGAGNVNLVGTENTILGQGAGLNGATGSSTSDRLTAIGYQAGNVGNASQSSTLVGWRAGYANGGTNTVAIGRNAGNSAQGTYSVAVGAVAAATNQGLNAVAIGYSAGATNQGLSAIAIGSGSGNAQGNSSIVIGTSAGEAAVANSIVITTQNITSTGPGLFVDPVRSDSGNIVNAMFYNATTKEISYANAAAGANTQIQFNSNGALSGNSAFTWNNANAQALIGNILITQANNNLRSVNAIDLNATPSPQRITIGSGFDGNFDANVDPIAISRGGTLAVIDKYNIGNSDTNLAQRSMTSTLYADMGGATLTNNGRRLQPLQGALFIGNGTQTVTGGPVYATATGIGGFVGAGNITIGANKVDMGGTTTVSHIAGGQLTVAIGADANVGNAVGCSATLNTQTSATSNTTTGIGFVSSFGGLVTSNVAPTNVYGYYMPGTTATHGINNTNNWRRATNYYFLMNEDDAAQVRLGSLRRYHEFQFALATSGAVGIDKNNAQVQYLAPTANVDITGYSNMVVTASDGTNNDAQVDTLTIIVEQGATPYTVTMPTGSAYKYAGGVSTVGATANAVTMISVTAANVGGTTTYLTTVSPEFV